MSQRQPYMDIRINGVRLENFGAAGFVEKVIVDEAEDMADMCVIVIHNQEQRFTDDFLFLERGEMNVSVGYADVVVPTQDFVLDRPRFIFPEGGRAKIILIGHGKAMQMAEPEKRRLFINRTNSEIAIKIAKEYELEFDVDETIQRYTQISQMGESDMAFLMKRAAIEGFIVYVEDGTLHFHRERITRVPDGVFLRHRIGDENVYSGEFSMRLLFGGERIVATTFDKLAKKTIDVTFDDSPDLMTQESISADSSLRRAYQLVGNRSTRFLETYGHRGNLYEFRKMVEGVGRNNQFIIDGAIEAVGNPNIRARRIVPVQGFQNFDGDYWVSRIIHEVSSHVGYRSSIKLRRTVAGSRKRGEPLGGSITSSTGTRTFDRNLDNVTDRSEVRDPVSLS